MPDATDHSLSGVVVYFYAFDAAFEMRRVAQTTLLGQLLGESLLTGTKRNPRRLARERPLQVVLPEVIISGPHGPVAMGRTLKALRIGALSVALRVPFSGLTLAQLVAYHDLTIDGQPLDEHARGVALAAHRELMPYWVRPLAELPPEEAYTVFSIQSPVAETAAWLQERRRAVAGLLTQEADPDQLSEQEILESTQRTLSYYRHDLTVVDWDAALLIDRSPGLEESWEIIELANIELAELESYDLVIDRAMERAYADLKGQLPWRRGRVLRELGELYIDLARSNEALGNITKFFGDWHLARVYGALADRFHFSDWQRSIDAKLRTLDDRYQLLKQDRTTRLMLILEVMVVMLFVADLVLLVTH